MKAYDLTTRAENGLRRGYTTGVCATAAVKAALLYMLYGEKNGVVRVTLPDGIHFLPVEVASIASLGPNITKAMVLKDAGDDPDRTHQAQIEVTVRRNGGHGVRFVQGEGVGRVTQPGLEIPIGEPAINPVPRQMMRHAVEEVCTESEEPARADFDLQVGCKSGQKIAAQTFNPRLGIEGGISILGTSGIVEPKSLSSFRASIEIYIRVALGESPHEIVLAPGNLGQRFARSQLALEDKHIIQCSNFIGFALERMEAILEERQAILPRLWFVGHPGKLCKILEGSWDTHSRHGLTAVSCVAKAAERFGLSRNQVDLIEGQQTVERLIGLTHKTAWGRGFWLYVEEELREIVHRQLSRVSEVALRLFQLDGTALGMGGQAPASSKSLHSVRDS